MKNLNEYCLEIIDELKKIVAGESDDFESLHEYLADALDVEYAIGSRGDFLGGRVAITLGGPNVWLNSRFGTIEGAWGVDRFDWALPAEVDDELATILQEWFDCLR